MSRTARQGTFKLTVLGVVIAIAFAVGMAVPVATEAAGGCWTTCCELQPWRCVTCCPGAPCPDLACP